MKPLQIPNGSLPEILSHVVDYISPWSTMWPWFQLKLFAIRMGTSWRLIQGEWVARVTKLNLPANVYDGPLTHSIFIQTLVPREIGLDMLRELAHSGQCMWRSEGGDLIIELPNTQGSHGGYIDLKSNLQGPREAHNNELQATAENVPWRVFSGSLSASWVPNDDVKWEETLDEVAAEHGVGSIDQLQRISRLDFRRCVLLFDFPLGLDIAKLHTNVEEGTSSWIVACQSPLTLSEITLRQSTTNLYSPSLPQISIDMQKITREAWESSGSFKIRHPAPKFFVDVQALDHQIRLSYNIEEPTPTQILTNVVAYMYAQQLISNSVAQEGLIKKGTDRWKKHLLEGDGEKFEIAVANLLARFRCPVLFGGKVLDTPGIDLVAVHPNEQKVALISCKSGKGKNLTDYKDWANLGEAVDTYQKLMPGWKGYVILATHLPQHQLDALPDREVNLQKWGEQHLMQLLNATTLSEVENLLWPINDSNDAHYMSDEF